jgi:hypothetical protein
MRRGALVGNWKKLNFLLLLGYKRIPQTIICHYQDTSMWGKPIEPAAVAEFIINLCFFYGYITHENAVKIC